MSDAAKNNAAKNNAAKKIVPPKLPQKVVPQKMVAEKAQAKKAPLDDDTVQEKRRPEKFSPEKFSAEKFSREKFSAEKLGFEKLRVEKPVPGASLPERFDRYEVRGLLGQGAMGRVYLAYDPKLRREVAIKAIGKEFATHARARERFFREARAVATLKHSNIVEIFDYSGEDSKQVFLVMERLLGPDLFQLVDKRGPMPEAVAAAILHELCGALATAHDAGVIHRDLKPENVLIEWNGRVVLTDFGLVKAFAQSNLMRTDSFGRTDVIGTPGFMAPEQARGERLGPHTDVFALGALYYNLLTQRLPFSGATPLVAMENAAQGRYHDPRTLRPDLSETTYALLTDCLGAQPKNRLQSMRVVSDRLAPIFRACGVTDPREEIARYLRAPDAHADDLRGREARFLRDRIKLATLDGDEKHLKRLRQRLRVLAENNDKTETPLRRKPRGRSWKKSIATAAAAIVCGLALGGAIGLAVGKPVPGHAPPKLYTMMHGLR